MHHELLSDGSRAVSIDIDGTRPGFDARSYQNGFPTRAQTWRLAQRTTHRTRHACRMPLTAAGTKTCAHPTFSCALVSGSASNGQMDFDQFRRSLDTQGEGETADASCVECINATGDGFRLTHFFLTKSSALTQLL